MAHPINIPKTKMMCTTNPGLPYGIRDYLPYPLNDVLPPSIYENLNILFIVSTHLLFISLFLSLGHPTRILLNNLILKIEVVLDKILRGSQSTRHYNTRINETWTSYLIMILHIVFVIAYLAFVMVEGTEVWIRRNTVGLVGFMGFVAVNWY